MHDFHLFPSHFLLWPYYGSPDDDQDAHEALERAAASLLPGGLEATTPRRPRGRPRSIRPDPATEGMRGRPLAAGGPGSPAPFPAPAPRPAAPGRTRRPRSAQRTGR